MGISGLKTYVDRNFRKWEKITLDGDCSLAIDANALSYHIAGQCDSQWWIYGGGYEEYEQRLDAFLSLFLNVVNPRVRLPLHVVFDGLSGKVKGETVISRKIRRLSQTIASVRSAGTSLIPRNVILPPLVSEVFRAVIRKYEAEGSIRVYVAEGEADGIAVAIANNTKSYVVGNDSDYFIYPIDKGFIPIDKIEDHGGNVKCSVYKRCIFAKKIGIDLNLVTAIPALAGNDVIEGIQGYNYNDIHKAIEALRKTSHSQMLNDPRLPSPFPENYEKACKIYEKLQNYEDDCSFKTCTDRSVPNWITKNFKKCEFAKDLLGVLVNGQYLLHIVPDDDDQRSTKLLSQPIRQAIYGIMFAGRHDVIEIVRQEKRLIQKGVPSISQDLSIYNMTETTEEERINNFCNILECDVARLGSLDHDWYIPVASLCYWIKNTDINSVDSIKYKALALCIACMRFNDKPDCSECRFSLSTLHQYSKWQCVYYDALHLNQVLALPLLSQSPALVFDGRIVTYLSQQRTREFEEIYKSRKTETQNFYDQILRIVERIVV